MALLCSTILLSPGTAGTVDGQIWVELGRVQQLQASFTQTQHRAILKNPLVSTGTVTFHRPDRLDWNVQSPAASHFLLEGSVATMEYPALGVSERVDLAAVPEANRIATSMMVWLKADPAQVEREFTVTWRQDPPGANLRPKDAKLAGILAEIQLNFLPSPWRVSSVDLKEPSGDSVHISFRQVVLDGQKVPDP